MGRTHDGQDHKRWLRMFTMARGCSSKVYFGRQPKIEDIRNQIEAFAPCILDYALARICQYKQAASIAI